MSKMRYETFQLAILDPVRSLTLSGSGQNVGWGLAPEAAAQPDEPEKREEQA